MVLNETGTIIYFTALTPEGMAGIFSVPAAGGTATAIMSGGVLQFPFGLALSCDNATLIVVDLGSPDEETTMSAGALYSVPVSGGSPTRLTLTGVDLPTGIAYNADCSALYVAGHTADGRGAVFTVAPTGGAATAVVQGPPLMAPSDIHVDMNNVAYVVDHMAVGGAGRGVLFRITGGVATEAASGLALGTPGGVATTARGGSVIIPTRTAAGAGQLTIINAGNSMATQLAAPDLVDPAGIGVARMSGTFAVVDSEGGAIFRAQ